MTRSSARPTGRAGRDQGLARERRSRSRTTLRGRSAAAESSVRNFSAQATIGRQKKKVTAMTRMIMTAMAMPTWLRLLCWIAAAT